MIYQRQESLELNTNISVSVVGCGGIGFHVAKMLVMSGVEEIYLFDDDTFEEHNFNRIDIPLSFVGKNKAEVTAIVLKKLRPDAFIKFYPFKFKEYFWKKTDWLVDCTDRISSQEEVFEIAKKNNAKYVKAGYDGIHISINNVVAEWGVSEDGYTIIPSWIVPANIVAAMTVAKILKYPEKELSCNIDKMFIFKD